MKKPGLWQRFSNLVSDSSPLMTRVGQVALLAVCNLCWLVCSLPVVTTAPPPPLCTQCCWSAGS